MKAYQWRPAAGDFSRESLSSEGLLPTFEDQLAAEDWLGLFYDDLAAQGVTEVSLYCGDELVYGPMGLEQ